MKSLEDCKYFETDNGVLYQGDCLDVMQRLINDGVTVDAVITDPPYGITQCKWDAVIPFDQMWARLHKLAKERAAIVLFGAEPFASALRMSNIKRYRYDWVWVKSKPTGYVHAKNRPMRKHESIMVFSRGVVAHASLSTNRMTYNPQGTYKCARRIKRNKCGLGGAIARKSQTSDYIGTTSGYPSTVLEYNNVIPNKTAHPTQNPLH